MSEKVIALIPAYNEASAISTTIYSLRSSNLFAAIYVADDGSDDETGIVARKSGAEVIELTRSGKGSAVNFALKEIAGFDILLLCDADLGSSAGLLASLITLITDEKADMAIASFPPASRKGGFGLVKGLARFLIAKETGMSFISPLSGQRAMRRELLEKIMPFETGFGIEVASTIKAFKTGAKIVEVPLALKHRETGRDL